MNLLVLAVVLLGWAVFDPPAPPPEPIRVSATAYTCDAHPRNPMTSAPGMCQVLANGSRDVMSAGMACPASWMGRAYHVEGFGVMTCDDTGAYDEWNGLIHIDIRVPTYADALAWGVREIEIREVWQ